MTKIVLKHGTGVPADTDLEVAEVAIDNVSGAMYTKLADLSVKHLNEGGASSWNDLTDKPAEFPPESHTQDWSTITNTPADYPPSAHNHDGVYQPVGDYIEDADSDGKQYARQDGAWSEIAIPDGGTGSSVHIGDTPPDGPEEGQQWMEVPASGDATMWIYDGAKWLQHPGGKDGAPGADGNIADATTDGVIATWNNAAGQWTPDSSLTIDSSGNASFSGKVGVGGSGTHPFHVGTSTEAFSVNNSANAQNQEIDDGHSKVVRVNANNFDTNSPIPLALRCSDFYIDANPSNPLLKINGDTGNATFNGEVTCDLPAGGINLRLNKASQNPQMAWAMAGTDIWSAYADANSKAWKLRNLESSNDCLTIDSNGNAKCSGNLTGKGLKIEGNYSSLLADGGNSSNEHQYIIENHSSFRIVDKTTGSFMVQKGPSGTDDVVLRINPSGDATFSGTVTVEGSRPVISTRDLIETLATLREATKDETTIKGLRDAIGNAVGGLIEKFEAMQASTQEISDE